MKCFAHTGPSSNLFFCWGDGLEFRHTRACKESRPVQSSPNSSGKFVDDCRSGQAVSVGQNSFQASTVMKKEKARKAACVSFSLPKELLQNCSQKSTQGTNSGSSCFDPDSKHTLLRSWQTTPSGIQCHPSVKKTTVTISLITKASSWRNSATWTHCQWYSAREGPWALSSEDLAQRPVLRHARQVHLRHGNARPHKTQGSVVTLMQIYLIHVNHPPHLHFAWRHRTAADFPRMSDSLVGVLTLVQLQVDVLRVLTQVITPGEYHKVVSDLKKYCYCCIHFSSAHSEWMRVIRAADPACLA